MAPTVVDLVSGALRDVSPSPYRATTAAGGWAEVRGVRRRWEFLPTPTTELPVGDTTEALERAYPLRVLRYRIREGSGGTGFARGGDGIERDVQVLEDCTVSLITERRVSRPWGLAGGEPGAAGENWLLPGGDEARAQRLPDKCTIDLRAGDVIRMLTPGGGGWGEPLAE